LQRAMRQALFTNAAPAQQPAPPAPVENFDAQLEQLSMMGFMDREENLRALRATAGNFEAALEFIINERESMGLDPVPAPFEGALTAQVSGQKLTKYGFVGGATL